MRLYSLIPWENLFLICKAKIILHLCLPRTEMKLLRPQHLSFCNFFKLNFLLQNSLNKPKPINTMVCAEYKISKERYGTNKANTKFPQRHKSQQQLLILGAREMTQRINYLMCKHEDQSLNPQHPCKCQGCGGLPVIAVFGR